MPVLASERLDPVDPIDTPAGAVGTADLAALDVYVHRARMSKHRRSEHARVTGTPRHCRDPQWLGDGEVRLDVQSTAGRHCPVGTDHVKDLDPWALDVSTDPQSRTTGDIDECARAVAVHVELEPRAVGGERAPRPNSILPSGSGQVLAAEVGVDTTPPWRVGVAAFARSRV